MEGLHGGLHGHDEAIGGGGGAPTVPLVVFRANGKLDLIEPSVANTYAGTGVIDSQILFSDDTTLDTIVMYQRLAGASGSTTGELYRFSAGVWTEIALSGALTLAFGTGANASITRTFGPTTFLAGDRAGFLLTAVQEGDGTNDPTDLNVAVYEAP